MVLNTWARGWPGRVARHLGASCRPATHLDRRPRVGGGRDLGQQAWPAGRCPPRSTAEPHTTGNTGPAATPWARVASSSRARRRLALEVALHEVVVAHDDALDELLAHLVLLGRRGRRGSGPVLRLARLS